MPLTCHHLPARSGRPQSGVVLLHGFGSSGGAMLGLARALASELPDTEFLAPDAPHEVPGGRGGRMWFTIPELDGSSAAEADARLRAAAHELDACLDAFLAKTGLPAAAVALLGFSQGAGMCYEVGPRRPHQLAAVVAIAGRLKRRDALAGEVRSRPPFLILTGDADSLTSANETAATAAALEQVGIPVRCIVMPDTGHGISADGVRAAGSYLRVRLAARNQPGH